MTAQTTADRAGSDNPSPDKQITKRDLVVSWLIWTVFSHSNYNYERLQATGFAHSMTPIIKRLYGGDKEATSAALQRHLVFYNTSPDIGGVINGVAIAMEEQKASGKPVTDDSINSMKTGLMGPLAGVGDTITQGIVMPLVLALGISITGLGAAPSDDTDLSAMTGNPLGPILFLLLISTYIIGVGYFMYTQGYYRGRSMVTSIFKSGLMDRVIVGAGVLGNMVLGGLSASFISLNVGASVVVGEQSVRIQQDVLDHVMPGLLPLALVLFTWWLLQRGWHPIKLLLIYVAVCILGAIPFLGPAPQFVSDACGSSILQPYSACADPIPVEEGE
ncbi:PTS system mannose/fructose/sorbose family transporter subunit IID [Humidisolicoccus flavus]|uniref:PTS system mannose/fructose/sorbose family transporter subunit IID n=1 Tax=Humidisolicoccus flavus TaxID=3111414 RepID=UPI00324FEEA2